MRDQPLEKGERHSILVTGYVNKRVMETGPAVDLVAETQALKVRQPLGAEVIMPGLGAEAVHHLVEILLGQV